MDTALYLSRISVAGGRCYRDEFSLAGINSDYDDGIFAGREHILAAYEEAVRQKYRFFSFGDAMFLR